jgi:hypothetical protein
MDGSVGNTGVVEGTWLLASVRHGDVRVPVPASVGAKIEFHGADEIMVGDGVNVTSGRCHPTPTGFVITPDGTTLAAFCGPDPTTLTVIEAMRALVTTGSGPEGGFHPTAVVQAHRDGDQLVLGAGGYELIFKRSNEVAVPSPSIASST